MNNTDIEFQHIHGTNFRTIINTFTEYESDLFTLTGCRVYDNNII